jgi:hypothetical protein
MATAVLPVCRSPMMSSRCPRPMGTMASMGLRPVCMGWLTDRRGKIPGALVEVRRRSLELMGPFPSMGFPRASRTRPRSSGPTGTSRDGANDISTGARGKAKTGEKRRTDDLSGSLDGVALLDQSIVSEDGNSAAIVQGVDGELDESIALAHRRG